MSEAAASGGLSNQLLNRLRAAVLGANDGIVSTASVVMGVAGATSEHMMIVTAGLAALVAGALSMAVGEYVSVSSQADAEKAYIAKRGQKPHDDINSPLQAAIFSFAAFVAGGVVPFVAVLLAPEAWRVAAIMAAVVAALVCTGYFSARAGKASARRATLRVVTGGVLAMVITYYVGVLFGVAVG